LHLLVLISPPVLFAAGMYLTVAYSTKIYGRFVLLLAITVPVISNELISAHYRKRKRQTPRLVLVRRPHAG
jgi:hypothetical protein